MTGENSIVWQSYISIKIRTPSILQSKSAVLISVLVSVYQTVVLFHVMRLNKGKYLKANFDRDMLRHSAALPFTY